MSGPAVTAERHGRKSMASGRGEGIAWWKSLLGTINGSSNTRMPSPEPGKTTHATHTLSAGRWARPAVGNKSAQSDATTCGELLMYHKAGWQQNGKKLTLRARSRWNAVRRLKLAVWKCLMWYKAASESWKSRGKQRTGPGFRSSLLSSLWCLFI